MIDINNLTSIIYPIGLLILGYVIGKSIGLLTKFLLKNVLGLYRWLEMKGIKAFEGKVSLILSNIVKWYIYVYFISEALFQSKIKVLEDIGVSLAYVTPSIFLAIFIFVIGLLVIELITREVITSFDIPEKQKPIIIKIIRFIGIYAISVFALSQTGIDTTILIYMLVIIFAGVVLAISIAVGIAFGFALKDKASDIIERFFK